MSGWLLAGLDFLFPGKDILAERENRGGGVSLLVVSGPSVTLMVIQGGLPADKSPDSAFTGTCI